MVFLKKYGIYAVVLILVVVLTFYKREDKKEIIIEETVKEEIKEVINKIKIDIKGEVKKPGVYEIEDNLRVIDAITLAGGVKTTADTSNINLSMNLSDEMVIVVRSKEELIKKEVVIEYVEVACIEESSNLISINKGTASELDSLPGIGPSKANDIINYRNTNGLFKNIEDIKNVTGIGDSLFDQIKNLITL